MMTFHTRYLAILLTKWAEIIKKGAIRGHQSYKIKQNLYVQPRMAKSLGHVESKPHKAK